MKKRITVPRIEGLDEMKMDAVCERLEVEAPKCGINSVNWSDEFPYHPITVFSIARSDKYLYINFFVRCNYLRAVNHTNNSPVSEDSCVEFFMQVPGSDEYWNFEFNCIGAVNASHRKDRKNPTRLNEEEIASIRRYASCGTSPFQELEGLFSWSLAVAIPFELVGISSDSFPLEIRGNFYKCASQTSMPHYISWSPIETETPNFHCPEFFGDIVLE